MCLQQFKDHFKSVLCTCSYSFKGMVRWPTSATAKLTFPRQNLLSHGKTYFFTAKLTFPRQNLLSHGKTYFSTAKLTFPRQNLLSHGKTYFSTAKLTFCLKYGIWKGNLETESGIRNTVKVVERLKLPRKAISSTIHLVRFS